ncbi:MAG: ABC transporter permease, partial [Chloroflexi bacterium]|nr:ABC transporter permease [Chloroflexota bacterium]
MYISDRFDASTQQALYSRFGLDKPLIVQFGLYVRNTFTGNFGMSFYRPTTSVATMIGEALPKSLAIILPAQIIYVI